MKHTDGQCALCDFKLEQAHPVLREWFYAIVKPLFPDCHISWSWRGMMDQNELFKDGSSFVMWPNSKHNKLDTQRRACSEALDLFRQVKGKYVCKEIDMRKIFESTVNNRWADRIQWGITVNGKHQDKDHFQLIKAGF